MHYICLKQVVLIFLLLSLEGRVHAPPKNGQNFLKYVVLYVILVKKGGSGILFKELQKLFCHIVSIIFEKHLPTSLKAG